MSLLTDFSDNVAALLLDDWGEAATVFDSDGAGTSATLAFVRGPAQIEDQLNDMRVTISSAEIHGTSTALTGLTLGAYVVDASGDSWDFQQYDAENCGMRTARCERATLTQIGHLERSAEDGTDSPTIAEDKLRRMVAESETFQGDDTLEAALQRSHRGGYKGPFVRPLAVVWQETYDGTRYAGGSMDRTLPSGSLVCHLQYDGEDDPAEWFGKVVEEIRDLAGRDDPGGPYSESHLSAESFSVDTLMEADKRFPQSLPFSVCRLTWQWGPG